MKIPTSDVLTIDDLYACLTPTDLLQVFHESAIFLDDSQLDRLASEYSPDYPDTLLGTELTHKDIEQILHGALKKPPKTHQRVISMVLFIARVFRHWKLKVGGISCVYGSFGVYQLSLATRCLNKVPCATQFKVL